MPSTAPGKRVDAVATKSVLHGHPTVENGVPGIAFKSQQALPALPTVANSTTARTIAIGEEFIIDVAGRHEILASLLPGGVGGGDPIFIRTADNVLVAAAGGGIVKFALCESDPVTSTGLVAINFNLRDTF